MRAPQWRRGLRLLPLALLAAGLYTAAALADDDHERVRRLRQAGDILPLGDILQRAQLARPGRVIEVELEQEHGRYLYELEVLDQQGQLWELHYDARSGKKLTEESGSD